VIETRTGLNAERGLVFEDTVETRIEEEMLLQKLYTVMAKTVAMKEALVNEE